MGTHLESYLASCLPNTDLIESIRNTVLDFKSKALNPYSYHDHSTGLLLGNVQSGKTGQLFGIITECADTDFEVFVLLTSDNVYLHQQTLERALIALETFNICDETDEIRFKAGGLRKPTLIILKKNTNVLSKWRAILQGSRFLEGRPIVVLDDEADAASLNTKVNKSEISKINLNISQILHLASSSLYLQITATPQGILLQSLVSRFRPQFVCIFKPGKRYLGGDFFYSNPKSYTIKFTAENELDSLRDPSEFIGDGLRRALICYLITAAHLSIKEKADVCNFLIHVSVRIADHEIVAEKIGEHLNLLFDAFSSDLNKTLNKQLQEAWHDLQSSKPDLLNLEDSINFIHTNLDSQNFKILIMNSKSPIDLPIKRGLNIVVGGNSLGRGVTFPGLQTIYYCRKSKAPQADTFWQHCRMFGYDRDPGLMRVFVPASLYKMFSELSIANQTLFQQIENHGLEDITLMYPENIKPTRRNIIDTNKLNFKTGGVNYFPSFPVNKSVSHIDNLLSSFSVQTKVHEVDHNLVLQILDHVDSENEVDWNVKTFIGIIKLLLVKKPTKNVKLIIRKDRDISKGTGTLLSPDDRELGNKFRDNVVLTMYRIIGSKEKGWQGKPLWIPNIKFPDDTCYFNTD